MGPTPGGRFATTRWSIVLAASGDDSAARSALAALCEQYWYPLYAYARRRGAAEAEAQDLTQGFFAELLEKRTVDGADPTRGRFRGFLATAFRRYTTKVRERANTQKRGGGRPVLSLDMEDGEARYRTEPVDDVTPERVFERRWALTLLGTVLARLEAEFQQADRAALFAELRVFLGGGGPTPTHSEVATRMHMSQGAVKVAVHRLRRRYRDLLREEIARTIDEDTGVDDEIRHLVAALRG